jgi:voltage-gated potassium channel
VTSTPSEARLAAYHQRTGKILVSLAFGFLIVYAIPILWPSGHRAVLQACDAIAYVIWAIFVLDFGYRIFLAPRRWSYIARHPVDLLVILLPALRPLRVLRVFTAGQMILARGKHFAIGRTLLAAAAGGALITFIAALAVLDAERGHLGANINGFGDAIWWAGVTITTVGYGDRFPVTGSGRAVAMGLMVAGISLLGIVTATVAAWFVHQVAAPAEDERDELLEAINELRAEVRQLKERA